MNLKYILEIMKEAAVKAGEEILVIYNSEHELDVRYKEGEMPLTIADQLANDIIVERLGMEFPECAILSEESRDNKDRLKNDYCFIVDPLDGTKEFVKHNGQFTVNIALSYKHKSIIGVIYVPVTGELFFALEGKGAYYEKDHKTISIAVSSRKREIRAVMSSSHGCEQMDRLIEKYNIKDCISIGSSLKGCLIAKGEAEVYYRFNPTMEWDTAAMQCIVEEAGAEFRQMDGSVMLYNRENSVNSKGFYIINCKDNKLEL